ncbi:MAG TPA: hypothetical protein VGY77_01135 [Gemmataceae bacterium]|jgi:nucleoid-associated protein YgaU|nr:hypothetical protein [Gemmataceae bacterium]
MMTRETKLGLVVSCSFLCLVGVVLYTKLNESGRSDPSQYMKADGSLPDIPDPKPAEADRSPKPAPPGSGTPGSEPVKENPNVEKREAAPIPLPPNMIDPSLQRIGAENPSSAPTSPNPGAVSSTPQQEKNPFEGLVPTSRVKENEKEDQSSKDSPPPPMPPAEGVKKPDTDPLKNPESELFPFPKSETTKPESDNGFTIKPDREPKNKGNDQEKAADSTLPEESKRSALEKAKEKPSTAPFIVPGAPEEKKDPAVPVPSPTPAPGPWTNAQNSAGSSSPPEISMPSPGMVGIPPYPNPDPLPKSGGLPSGTPIPVPPPESSGSKLPVIGTSTPKPDVKSGGVDPERWEAKPPVPVMDSGPDNRTMPTSSIKDKGSNSNIVLGSPNPVPGGERIGQTMVRPSDPGSSIPGNSIRPIPALGSETRTSSPPVAISGGRGTSGNLVPEVDSYDEETYVCKAGDTLEEISFKYYQNKKYAQALMLFNRNHPRAAASLGQNPPMLRDGQALYIPPTRILDKQFEQAGGDAKTTASGVAPASEKTVRGETPGFKNPVYRVVSANEMISTIARDTLGDMNRWNEIYQLNKQSVDPSRPLMVGTLLNLPADAQIKAENRP